jgi:hypothetical protein
MDKLTPRERRNDRIVVCVTLAEGERLRRVALAEHASASQIARKIILNYLKEHNL